MDQKPKIQNCKDLWHFDRVFAYFSDASQMLPYAKGGGEWCFKNIFLFPICIIQKVTILAPRLSLTFMEIGNQMQNHKVKTNRELIYEDGSFWSTLIFIKIIGSDTVIPITTNRGPLQWLSADGTRWQRGNLVMSMLEERYRLEIALANFREIPLNQTTDVHWGSTLKTWLITWHWHYKMWRWCYINHVNTITSTVIAAKQTA